MAKIDDLVKQIEELSILEVSELVKNLEEKFDISAAAPVAVANNTMTAETSSTEEKDSYTVVISDAGENKINVIKALREIKPELGLKDAKDMADNLPATVTEDSNPEEANEIKKKLEEAGAKIELK